MASDEHTGTPACDNGPPCATGRKLLAKRRRSSTIPLNTARNRSVALRALLRDIVPSVLSRRYPGMFANILVPLDGSALSEQALSMAQNLARSSDTCLHLLRVIALRPELEALRGSGSESITVLEMAQDTARRLREVETARSQ